MKHDELKKETAEQIASEVTTQILQSIKAEVVPAVEKSIEATVNGKIRDLHRKFDEYVEGDMAWKVRAEPVVKAFENSSWLFKLFITFLKTIGLMGGAGAILFSITKFIKSL